jgi:hypothetical protein
VRLFVLHIIKFGEPTTSEFTLLNNLINTGSTTSPSGLLTNGLFMYSSYFSNGSFGGQGSDAHYYSSTAIISTPVARSLTFSSGVVNPAASAYQIGEGFAVRCVAP